MQCVNCQFENMPGTSACVRCGTSMTLATAVIDVHPPRAGRWSKRVRRLSPRVAVRVRTKDAVGDVVGQAARVLDLRLDDSVPAVPLLLRALVPGWPQLYVGMRVLGRVMLYAWVGLLLVWLLFCYGTVMGSVLLGLAFSAHAASVAGVLNRVLDPMSALRRIGYAVGVTVLVLGLIYLPAGRLLFAVADPVVMQMDQYPFEQGDVGLVNRAALVGSEPRAGQVVLYTPAEYRTTVQHGMIIYGGPRIDRILAGPGDRVRWVDGRLYVNGKVSGLEPLNRSVMPRQFEVSVPAEHYLIVPTTTPAVARPPDLLGMALIGRDRIAGVVWLQNLPLTKLKVIE